MTFRIHQKVILPKSHNEKEGVVTVVPKPITVQTGLQQKVNRVKVSYLSGNGGMTEGWFKTEGENALTSWKSPKDITAELEAKHKKEMEAVQAEKNREKLDWMRIDKPSTPIKESNRLGENITDSKIDNSDTYVG